MKKCLIAVMALLFMFAAVALALDVEIGSDVEVMLDKKIELDNLGVDVDLSAQHYDLTAGVNVGDWIKVTPKVGLTHLTATMDSFLLAGVVGMDKGSGIGWNMGMDMDAMILSTEWADLHLIGGYQFSRIDIDEIGIAGIMIDNPLETIVYLHEYEIGGVISKDLREIEVLKEFNIPVTPYIGVVYSDMIGNVDINSPFIDLNEDISAKKNIGLRCGLTAKPIENMTISIGAKFVDETAVMISGAIKF